jgi:ABC-type cobalamin/Fe3+-siderophores transport system ATPase subunit
MKSAPSFFRRSWFFGEADVATLSPAALARIIAFLPTEVDPAHMTIYHVVWGSESAVGYLKGMEEGRTGDG